MIRSQGSGARSQKVWNGKEYVPWSRIPPQQRKLIRRRRRRQLIFLRELAVIGGYALVVAGTALIDWRVGLIVAGAIAGAAALYALARG